MAYRTDNRHSLRFRARKALRRFRDSLDGTIDNLFVDGSRRTV
jgi:hypothetical protein